MNKRRGVIALALAATLPLTGCTSFGFEFGSSSETKTTKSSKKPKTSEAEEEEEDNADEREADVDGVEEALNSYFTSLMDQRGTGDNYDGDYLLLAVVKEFDLDGEEFDELIEIAEDAGMFDGIDMQGVNDDERINIICNVMLSRLAVAEEDMDTEVEVELDRDRVRIYGSTATVPATAMTFDGPKPGYWDEELNMPLVKRDDEWFVDRSFFVAIDRENLETLVQDVFSEEGMKPEDFIEFFEEEYGRDDRGGRDGDGGGSAGSRAA